MRLAILTDAHANLPALRAALAAVDRFAPDLTVHTGDAIGTGPYPRECLELLLARPATRCLMGNHDAWYAFGLPDPRPDWMSVGERAHQVWTHAQLGDELRGVVAAWPYNLRLETPAGAIELLHFPLRPNDEFLSARFAPRTGEEADALFGGGAWMTFYGHDHTAADVTGAATRYVNPGSLGCSPTPAARIAFLEVRTAADWTLSFAAERYDPTDLLRAFDDREVPERDFIRKVFMPCGA
jgi:predicted phosphodiesterase